MESQFGYDLGMKISDYLNEHLRSEKESPDEFAKRAKLGRASVFRAKSDEDLRMSTMRRIVSAVGKPFIIDPSEIPQESSHAKN